MITRFAMLAAVAGLCAGLGAAGAKGKDKSAKAEVKATGAADSAGKALAPKLKGTVKFTAVDSGVKVEVKLSGVPAGEHGFHVHAGTSCDDTAKAAGGHFDPDSTKHHSMPDSAMHHGGDLGNVTAGPDGKVALEKVFPHLALEGAKGIVGHALVLHAKPDDGMTQPSGNSGARIGCGIIK